MSLKSSNKTDVNTTELVISIDADAFEAAVEKEYQRQKKNIQIKGFRKGKVSRKLAEREFGEGAFYEGAINSLLGPEIDAAVKETGLVLLDRPNVEVTSIDKEQGVELKAICVTKPEIEISDYKGIKAAKEVKEITDEDIDKQIDIIRKKNARIVSVEDRAATSRASSVTRHLKAARARIILFVSAAVSSFQALRIRSLVTTSATSST